MNKDTRSIVRATLLAGVSIGVCYILLRHGKKIYRKLQIALDFRNPLRFQHVEIVTNADECRQVMTKIKSHCNEYNVVGFDCEWVTVGGTRRPVALLQLATHRGLCALIRLCNLRRVPKELKDFLENYDIVKVGVVPLDDANYLYKDYGVSVTSTLDLRHLAAKADAKPEGLAKMSKAHLNVDLNKNWRLSCSDWETKILTDDQIKYAANDAHVAIELFRIFIKKTGMFLKEQKINKTTCTIYDEFLDKKFNVHQSGTPKKQQNKLALSKPQNRLLSTRAAPLYDNCYMQAPDGEILCTCDRKKATWYVEMSLGTVVSHDPYTVQLNFEPSGRAVGEVGKFYQQIKLNRCVTCGETDSYIRKNVIPLEYRKYFPDVMKSHMSHDVLLLCPVCHQKSNISDLDMRRKLAILCKASITQQDGTTKVIEKPHLKKLKSAARALYLQGNKIPDKRRQILEKELLKHYSPGTKITDQLLKEASDMTTFEINENYVVHGQAVVEYFKKPENGGLTSLERMWRKHFLNIMEPKYLPELWSVDHNAERLEIRAEEGRVEYMDLVVAGVKKSI